jgi:hypothetical protein
LTPITQHGDSERPTECHTFGVPVVTDQWGNAKQVTWLAKGSLVPWQISGLEDLWVPIDDTLAQLRRFTQEGPDPQLIINTQHQAGHLVVVSGRKRSGKTTFMHKIVHELALRLEEFIVGEPPPADPDDQPWTLRTVNPTPHVRIVPLAGLENDSERMGWANGAPVGVETVNRRILNDARAALGTEIEKEAVGDLDSDDLLTAYQALSSALMSSRIALILLLPDFRWKDDGLTRTFYRSCHDNAMPGIVFFVESSSERSEINLTDELGDLSYSHATHLRIGDLKDTDWIDFIEARHRATHIPGPSVRFAADVLDGEPEDWMKRNVGNLQRTLHEVTRQAHADRKAEINAVTLRSYTATVRQSGTDRFRRRRDDGQGPQA